MGFTTIELSGALQRAEIRPDANFVAGDSEWVKPEF